MKCCVIPAILVSVLVGYFAVNSEAAAAAAAAADLNGFVIKSGWEFMGAVEGKIFLTPIGGVYVGWWDAKAACHKAGYQMALIESKAQDDLLDSYYKSVNKVGFAWIDGSDFVVKGEWHSIRTGQVLNYANWQQGRPVPADNPYSDEVDCLMWKKTAIQGPGSFWDVQCTDTNYVVCEHVL